MVDFQAYILVMGSCSLVSCISHLQSGRHIAIELVVHSALDV